MNSSTERSSYLLRTTKVLGVALFALIALILIPGCGGGDSNTGSENGLTAMSANPKGTQSARNPGPPVAWSPDSLYASLAPGGSTMFQVEFTPSVNATGVTTFVVPEIADHVSLNPSSFATLAAGQTYSIDVTLTSPPGVEVAEKDGVIMLRQGRRALARPLPVNLSFGPKIYTVTATAGTGGSIDPGSQTVDHGVTAEFTVTPDAGYVIDSVSGCAGSLEDTTYTTGPVMAACTVSASFAVDNNPIQLSPPAVSGALLPNMPAVLQPRVIYSGEDRLDFQLLVGPDQMEIDPRSGLIGWTPAQTDAGGIFNVQLQVTDGTVTNSVAFAVRVARPTALETVAESLPDGWARVTVTEADVQLQGLQVILPPDFAGPSGSNLSTGLPGVSLVDPADVPGGGDYSEADVIRLTEFFLIDPVRAASEYVEIVFPDLALPEGRSVEELVLYVHDRVLYISDSDSTLPVWVPVTYAFELNDDGLASILTRETGALSFIGLIERTEQGTGLLPLPSEPDLRQYTLASPLDDGVTQVPVSCKDEGLNVDRQLCSIEWPGVGENDVCPVSGLTNCEARVRISGFSSNAWSDPPAGFSVHHVAGWVLDSMLRFEALGLGYRAWAPGGRVDADIEIEIGKIRDRKFFNQCSSWGVWYRKTPDVLRLQSNDGCQNPKSVRRMATALAHEYMHHAQDRAGLEIPAYTFSDAYSKFWLYEGTAVWFQDDVYDGVDFYREFFGQGLRVLESGLSARHNDYLFSRSNGYRRFGFFKLLQRTGTDQYGCEFETPNAANRTFLAALFNEPMGDGGEQLIQVMGTSHFQCDFGDTFGQNRLMGNALEFYTHATLQMDDVSLLDHNEKKRWQFEPPLLVAVEPGTIASFRQERLPPLSARTFFLWDWDGRDGFKRELVVGATPNGSDVLVSIRSSDGELKESFVIDSGPVVRTVGYERLQDWVISFVNDDPTSDLEVEFAISRLGWNTLAAFVRDPDGIEYRLEGKRWPQADGTSWFELYGPDGISCRGEFDASGEGVLDCNNGWSFRISIPQAVYEEGSGSHTHSQDGFLNVAIGWGGDADSDKLWQAPPSPPIIGGALNDTGIIWSGDATSGNATFCDPAHPAGQDCHYGRDAQAVAGTLTKVGGGNAGFDFTKISNSGAELPASATLGNGPNDWACTRDNVTGLVWEVKVNDPNHLRHQGHTYTWYDLTSPDGNPGTQNGGTCSGSACDTTGFVQAVNAQGLCGASDWRMPTLGELQGIVDYGRHSSAFDTGYFPNTPGNWFWSDSPYARDSNVAWSLAFAHYGLYRSNSESVLLVRGGQ